MHNLDSFYIVFNLTIEHSPSIQFYAHILLLELLLISCSSMQKCFYAPLTHFYFVLEVRLVVWH